MTIFEDFFKAHWQNILIAGTVIVIIVGVVVYAKEKIRKSNAKAAGELCAADTIEELEAVIKKFPDHKSSDYARAKLGRRYFETGSYDKASEIFNSLSKKSRYKDLRAQAALNLAVILEQTGKTEEAAQKYSLIGRSTDYPEEYRADANCQAARIYISMNKNSLAKACLELIKPEKLRGEEDNQHYQKAKFLEMLM